MPIAIWVNIWYYIYVIKREKNKNLSKKNSKKFKKSLDKPKKVWYNKYVIKRNANLFDK